MLTLLKNVQPEEVTLVRDDQESTVKFTDFVSMLGVSSWCEQITVADDLVPYYDAHCSSLDFPKKIINKKIHPEALAKATLEAFSSLKFIDRRSIGLGFDVITSKLIKKNTILGCYVGNFFKNTGEKNASEYVIGFDGQSNDFSVAYDAAQQRCLVSMFSHLPAQKENSFLTQYNDIAFENIAIIPYIYKVNNQRIMLFVASAKRDIQPGEIIGFDYGDEYWNTLGREPHLFKLDGSIITEPRLNPMLTMRVILGNSNHSVKLTIERPNDLALKTEELMYFENNDNELCGVVAADEMRDELAKNPNVNSITMHSEWIDCKQARRVMLNEITANVLKLTALKWIFNDTATAAFCSIKAPEQLQQVKKHFATVFNNIELKTASLAIKDITFDKLRQLQVLPSPLITNNFFVKTPLEDKLLLVSADHHIGKEAALG